MASPAGVKATPGSAVAITNVVDAHDAVRRSDDFTLAVMPPRCHYRHFTHAKQARRSAGSSSSGDGRRRTPSLNAEKQQLRFSFDGRGIGQQHVFALPLGAE